MAATETCSRCGQEVRWGWRDGREAYWHREDVDHEPIFGAIMTEEMKAYVEAELDRPRTRTVIVKGEEVEETYTARTFGHKGAAAAQVAQEAEDALDEAPDPIPAPEVARHDVGPDDFPPRSGIRQIHNLVAKTDGWEIVRFSACRGPYIGSQGKVLSISDSVVLAARGPVTGQGRRVAVASWRDGAFDFAHLGILRAGRLELHTGNSNAMKDWIKHRDTAP